MVSIRGELIGWRGGEMQAIDKVGVPLGTSKSRHSQLVVTAAREVVNNVNAKQL